MTMSSWLVVGRPENWETAFDLGNIWGLRQNQAHLWEALASGDIVFFYVTSPVSKIVGYGKILSKFKQDKPLWPEERTKGRVIWPLRFQFDITLRFRREEWNRLGIIHPDLRHRVRSGFQRIGDDLAEVLIGDVNKLYREPVIVGSALRKIPAEYKPSLHESVKEKLLLIGGLQKFVAEKEYQMDGKRLDVTWRRVDRGAPTYVFEIQIGGNLTEGLGKLKHAFDLWNSKLYLIAKEEDREKVRQLLEGTFHEIQPHVRFITLEEVEQLHKLKDELRGVEDRLGIL
ncbi:MAG: EVE domain-containing protein [Methanocellales archaeon]|nr:EVE domain-containing protein [Methanocellales archaeon]